MYKPHVYPEAVGSKTDILLYAKKVYGKMTMAQIGKRLGISDEYARLIMHGRRSLPKVLLDDLGFEKITIYIRKS